MSVMDEWIRSPTELQWQQYSEVLKKCPDAILYTFSTGSGLGWSLGPHGSAGKRLAEPWQVLSSSYSMRINHITNITGAEDCKVTKFRTNSNSNTTNSFPIKSCTALQHNYLHCFEHTSLLFQYATRDSSMLWCHQRKRILVGCRTNFHLWL
jgi:hypothetical protein